MEKYFFILIIILLFLLLLTLARVRVYLHYSMVGKDDRIAVEVSTLSGVLRYRLVLPFVKLERKRNRLVLIVKALFKTGRGRGLTGEKKALPVPGPIGSLKLLQVSLALLKKYAPAYVYLLHRTQIRKFCWRTEIGTGDPFYTGLATGAARSLKGVLLGALFRHVPPGAARPEMAVSPDFVNPCFKTSFECIFEIKVGHAALSGIKALVIRLKSAEDPTPG
ncbi:MAG: DUF2953 domain-containing protein [Eubacteriales bacterium]